MKRLENGMTMSNQMNFRVLIFVHQLPLYGL